MSESKRSYDARRRRERAGDERRETRNRVVAAARDLFIARGYTATSMADIAAEAGVALQTVYKAGTSKAELLHMVVDAEVAGDDEQVMFAQRESFQALARQTDPRRQVRMLADLIAEVQERSASIQAAYRQAAAVDASVAGYFEAAHLRRLQTFMAAIHVIPRAQLQRPPDEAATTVWAIASPEMFHLLRHVRDWNADQYRTWLRRTLAAVLLKNP
jgi:AcrR family transcriptional regulator